MNDMQHLNSHAEPLIETPQDYPRRVLLAVAGLSPQIVTETLYALAVQREPRFVPTEVQLITTETGARRAQESLLDEGHFHRLCSDYSLLDITFGVEQIRVLKGTQGEPLQDIRSLEDNTRAADTITEIVYTLTQDEETAVHVSIAGGRKTMGFYVGYALSLYGRQQEHLSHVLVDKTYESLNGFYYPTPKSTLICDKDGYQYDAKDAMVTLADIPFVRLRDGLDRALVEGRTTFSAAVNAAQWALRPQALELYTEDCRVRVGGESFGKKMEPHLFSLYLMLADRVRQGRPGFHWTEGPEEYLDYRKRYGLTEDEEKTYKSFDPRTKKYEYKFDPNAFEAKKSKIKQYFVKQMGGENAAEPYLIKKVGRVPGKGSYNRFGLKLPPSAIKIVE